MHACPCVYVCVCVCCVLTLVFCFIFIHINVQTWSQSYSIRNQILIPDIVSFPNFVCVENVIDDPQRLIRADFIHPQPLKYKKEKARSRPDVAIHYQISHPVLSSSFTIHLKRTTSVWNVMSSVYRAIPKQSYTHWSIKNSIGSYIRRLTNMAPYTQTLWYGKVLGYRL